MRKYLWSAAGVAALLVAGCGSPKDANKGNFKAALQQWFDANPVCVMLTPDQDLPIERAAGDNRNKAALDAAVAAGLLFVESTRSGQTGAQAAANTLRYLPTAAGKDALRQDDRFIGVVDICFARRKIETIDNFTEPADMMGVKASRVTFTYTLKDVAPWATQPALAAALPEIAQTLAKPPQTDTAALVLTNEGWKDEHALH